MQQLMDQINRKLRPYFGEFLNGSATLEEISQAEEEIGIGFPEDLKGLYQLHNGNADETAGLFFGMAFLPLEAMLSEWRFSAGIVDEDLNDEIPSYSVPAGAIKELYFNKKWIPLAHDSGGNYLGLDFDPGEKGTVGQVINYGRDEEVKYVVARSIKDFLAFILKTLEDGFYTIDEEESWSYSKLEDTHFFDALKNLALPVLQREAKGTEVAASLDGYGEEWKARIEKEYGSFKAFIGKKNLYLGAKGIREIAPLAVCSDLRELVLSSNEISDLTPLENLKSLKRLYIGGNPVESVEALKGLGNLDYLYLAHTPITDGGPLMPLAKLKELNMANTHIEDFSFLKQLRNLKTLSVSIYSPKQLNALSELPKLKHLTIEQMAGVTRGDLTAFYRLKNLESLTIKHAAFRELSFLTGCKKLKTLHLIDCSIEDAKELLKIPVENLECEGTFINNLEVIAESASLRFFAGSFQQFWALKQKVSRPIDFSKISGPMTEAEEELWLTSLREGRKG